jgi:nitrogen fixation NifU-like protein
MYKEEILDMYSEKPGFGKIKDKTHEIKAKNPFCNDEITIQLKIEKGKIKYAKFFGKTCFVSTISSCALMEMIKGKTIQQAKNLTKKDLDNYLKTKIIETRIKCQLFPLETLKQIK